MPLTRNGADITGLEPGILGHDNSRSGKQNGARRNRIRTIKERNQVFELACNLARRDRTFEYQLVSTPNRARHVECIRIRISSVVTITGPSEQQAV